MIMKYTYRKYLFDLICFFFLVKRNKRKYKTKKRENRNYVRLKKLDKMDSFVLH